MVLFFLAGSLPAASLQQAVERAMGGRAGAAVALDIGSGRILAQYHPAVAARRLASPGSTVKPFTLLALLDSGAAAHSLVCRRTVRIGGRELDCTHPPSGEALDPAAALAYSCNYYFASLARGLRDSQLMEAFERAGLTAHTGLAAGEAAGELIPPANAEARQLLALGEANILVTPLELVYAYRKLALRRKTAPEVLAGLTAATEYGTARLARPQGIKVAGKTGTSLDRAAGQAHAWFAGFAPADAPRVAVVVFLEQGVGGRDAAPVARQLFEAALPAF